MGFSDDESSGLGRASDEVRSSGSTRDEEPTSDAVERLANLQDSKEEVPAPPPNTQDLAASKPKSRHRDNPEWLASLGEKISETPTTSSPLCTAPATAEDLAAASKDGGRLRANPEWLPSLSNNKVVGTSAQVPLDAASPGTAENLEAAAKDGGHRRDIPEWLATLSDKNIEIPTSIPLDTGKLEDSSKVRARKKIPDNDRLRAVIQEGDREGLVNFLRQVNAEVRQKLTKTYGGTADEHEADEDGLFRNTSPLLHAAIRGQEEVFSLLAGAMETSGTLGAEMVKRDEHGRTVPQLAALSGNQATFSHVRKLVQRLSTNEIRQMLTSTDNSGSTVLMAAFNSRNTETFRSALEFTMEQLDSPQVRKLIEMTDNANQTLLSMAINTKDAGRFEFALNECRRAVGYTKVAETVPLDEIFSECAERQLDRHPGRPFGLKLLSSLMACSARPSPSHLKKLAIAHARGETFKDCCLDAVTSAANPFIPGLVLSIRLAEAAQKANEGERRAITDIQKSVNDLLLEVLERLPRSVRSFERDMDDCRDMFEPTFLDVFEDFEKPLEMMLARQQQRELFCNVPLVMDFLKRKFTLSLPRLRDPKEVLADSNEILHLSRGGVKGDVCLVLDSGVGVNARKEDGHLNDEQIDETIGEAIGQADNASSRPPWKHPTLLGSKSLLASFRSPRALLQGANDRFPSLTPFPGAQFIVAGLATRPNDYFRVPAMRMVLDLVVYIGMIVALSILVLFRSQAEQSHVEGSTDEQIVFRTLDWPEATCATVFIVGGVYQEGREMARNLGRYCEDQWNALDLLSLLFLTIGLVGRVVDWKSQLGPAFYALGAPLLVSRALFFVQIHPLQGPMIQVVFRMTRILLKFGFVIAVIMLGFTMAFHVLFRDFDSFGESFLDLFKAMLGDTGFFEVFSGDTYDVVATFLLVVYLFIVTVMLLNLLVAILSTSHAQVEENIEREFKVSIARMMDHYQLVVTDDMLPTPFNLLQLVVWPIAWCLHGCCGRNSGVSGNTQRSRNRSKEAYACGSKAIGPVVFWVVLGPVAVIGGSLLWMGSVLPAMYFWRKHHRLHNKRENGGGDSKSMNPWSLIFRYVVIIPCWCVFGAPVYLLLLWLNASRRVLFRCPCNDDTSSTATSLHGASKSTIESMLLKSPGGVGAQKLREFLHDPMDDKDVRQDEKDRRTTVEHIKLLRNRLENTSKEQLKGLEEALHQRMMKELGLLVQTRVGACTTTRDVGTST
ncbi:Transient Receptor Potential Channel [Ectocarpus siliculosus]|uniref:Transient Receptor Potential Channel n=1 Tax=Ectocarpus siliculosus TaxID=2880 RepID=D8LPZ1_ECTSI|nr:Transient Receptor Potential Channel [Ectocarpus siliculosus]|eukprot:CBN74883.1 Transient Receptor Potential Channel [Ectocarpus siliculosus]